MVYRGFKFMNLSKNKIRQCGEHIRQKEDFDEEILFFWRNQHLPIMANGV